MKTNGDPEGRILLSYPHTNKGVFFLLATVFIYLFMYLFICLFIYEFSIKYRYILLKKHKPHYNHLFCCNHTCCGMVSVTLAFRYLTSASCYQSRSMMYIRGLIPPNFTELAEAVPTEVHESVRNGALSLNSLHAV